MSLRVFNSEKEVEEFGLSVVKDNEKFFSLNVLLPNTEVSKIILSVIEKAKLVDAGGAIYMDRNGVILPVSHLTYGTKVLMNILSFPDKCFSVGGCDDRTLSMLSMFKEGNIVLDYPTALPLTWEVYQVACDIMYEGRHFSKITHLFNYEMENIKNSGI